MGRFRVEGEKREVGEAAEGLLEIWRLKIF